VSSFAHSFSSVFFTHSDKQTSDNFKPNTDTFPSEFFALLGNSMIRSQTHEGCGHFRSPVYSTFNDREKQIELRIIFYQSKDLKDDLGVIGNVLKTEL
jgi:hypothetical protein